MRSDFTVAAWKILGTCIFFIDGGEGLYDEVILEPFVIAKSFEGFDPEELVVDLGPKIIKFYVEGDVDIDEKHRTPLSGSPPKS